MGISTNLIHVVLFIHILLLTTLLIPLPKSTKSSYLTYLSRPNSPFFHILIGLYAYITLLLTDCIYKKMSIYTNTNLMLSYHNDKNLYLCAFTLFVSILYHRFKKVCFVLHMQESSAQVLKKQALNQNVHVEKIMKENREMKEYIKKIEDENKILGMKSQGKECIVKQAENNRKMYFELLDSYNKLREKISGETPKTK